MSQPKNNIGGIVIKRIQIKLSFTKCSKKAMSKLGAKVSAEWHESLINLCGSRLNNIS